METLHDQSLDSPSNSYIGSYYQPPDRILPRPEPPLLSMNTPSVGPGLSLTTHDVGSKAVIDALKALQEKIRRLELERKTAERNTLKFPQAASSFEHHNTTASTGHPRTPHPASSTGHPRTPHPASSTCHTWTPHLASSTGHTRTQYPVPTQNASNKGELVSQLQSSEARCQVLEKQLDHMRRMVEKAEQDKDALADKQASLYKEKASEISSLQMQREKLDKLEKECIKLSQTQSQAEMKMSLLEQKLKAEELERWRVQEKAEEIQKEMDVNLRLCSPPGEKCKPKKSRRSSPAEPSSEPPMASCPLGNRMPFVAGTSTSPSHSVHANMQSLLHMMKHHQPQLCHHVRSLQQPRGGARKSLRRALSTGPHTTGPHTTGPTQLLGSLSDLLLALQDELGQMSFEQQELVRQMEVTPGQEVSSEGLQRELESLLRKMEDKGVQITKLRQHQHTVHLLNQNTQRPAAGADPRTAPPPRPSPVRQERPAPRRGGASQSNLQLLKETQRFRSSLKTDDLTWET